ncbi:sugar phosphate isomerase/epimerase, partial [Escherichia coli]
MYFISKRTARAVLTGMCYSAGSAMRHGSSS